MYESNVFIDLPNFYSNLLRSGIDDPRILRDYFLNWLDFDLLTELLTSEYSNTWVFYSGNRLGPSGNRIEGRYLNEYVERINSLTGVTARNVNIPGEQREPASYICSQCGHEGTAQWESEKGIDSSLTVYLFDTMDSWQRAYLISGDADFVPAVQSLRRRGKIVIGAGFSNASPALKRECYDYIDLSELLFQYDVAAYGVFCRNGILEQWLTNDSSPIKDFTGTAYIGYELHKPHIILRSTRGNVDLSPRYKLLRIFASKHPGCKVEIDKSAKRCVITFADQVWLNIDRHLDDLISTISNLEPPSESTDYTHAVRHRLNPTSGKYSPAN